MELSFGVSKTRQVPGPKTCTVTFAPSSRRGGVGGVMGTLMFEADHQVHAWFAVVFLTLLVGSLFILALAVFDRATSQRFHVLFVGN